ncbi:MAG: c-type cytochrome [Prosthecobacter sp.]|jgi:putative heme-binding domain-containing protein|uniref:PVC-type heme-binding CxxCH protein n=1 Tax=Prosthecobacter sp. TaxID=1965333 RepID=UPI0019ECEBA2|nr:PVC-type heme-binding CxxCH protein [Prosthecobacter sp.]MBE2286221.1 c-type cytochrome [Prosthecobacter sp.]
MSFSRCLAVILIAAPFLHAADTRLVRETEALTPAEEQTKLHVPPGFTVRLFASEPMINKPINMAFDARGRLWVSSTVEYPYSADKSRWSDEKGTRVKDSRDAIKILEDTDGDGQADKVTDFADGLNIPTGVVPWHKPEHKAGCIAWSIPNIWYFADTDGDDQADVREVLFGPLGYEKDTHGMCSSFRLGLDGWVYATHGFNNTSHFKAKDGSTLDLHSGNVFRFKPDGSRVEKWTSGQVNPFGLAWDRYGNLYSADCHSSPIYQLIRGACYPSFGKPHDGLGFAPVMCEHTHGSTGICGIVYIDGGVWGPEWDDHTFVGNVVTSKVNHDKVTFTGSTPKANEKPDFLTSDDPWFRPVDLQLGPDNALYIADFYNKIIGHYEVPLEHPGRDKERGRIWRVVNTMHAKTLREPNLESRSGKELAQELQSPNLNRRALATELMVRRREVTNDTISPVSAAHSLWIGARLGKISTTEIQNAMNTSAVAAAQGFRMLGAFSGVEGVPGYYAHMLPKVDLAPANLGVPTPAFVIIRSVKIDSATGKEVEMIHGGSVDQWTPRDFDEYDKARIECMGLSQDRAAVLDLVKELESHPGDSTRHLTVKVGLRRLLSQPGVFKALPSDAYSAAEVVLAVSNGDASQWLWRMEESGSRPSSAHSKVLGHISRHGDDRLLQTAIHKAHASAGESSVVVQLERIQAIHNGLSERGVPPNPELLQWAQELATQLLTQTDKQPESAWISAATADNGPKWSLQTRKCVDGTEALVLQSMIKGGGDEERRIGVLKSKAFVAPPKLTLWINGHRGSPKGDAHDKNLVRVVDAESGETFAKVFPPRNDVCQRAEFDLSKHAGKAVRLEIVDGDDGKAYAWLGITRIEPPVISVNDFQTEDSTREALKTLAVMLQHTAPAALREKLAAYLPPRPAPPPLPVSPEQRKQLDALIGTRAAAFGKAIPDATTGKTLFKTHCAVCHQIGGEGGLIGPQLDGIGARGVERLCEDILDPNRNVDAHFHLHTLTLKDGSKMSGFLKGEAGQVLILADAAGREHRVSKNDLAKDETTPMSLMPPVFGQVLDETAFNNLIGFLLNEKTK